MTQFAIVAFPETDALTQIEDVRRRFDPQAGMIAAHITLVFPFESTLSSQALRGHVARMVSRVPTFECRLDGVRISDGDYLFLDVTAGRRHALALHERLYTGLLAEYWSPERRYEPHVTLGRVADQRTLEDARRFASSALSSTTATIRALSVFRLDGPGRGAVDSMVPLRLTSDAPRRGV